jgi:hypothetical protein
VRSLSLYGAGGVLHHSAITPVRVMTRQSCKYDCARAMMKGAASIRDDSSSLMRLLVETEQSGTLGPTEPAASHRVAACFTYLSVATPPLSANSGIADGPADVTVPWPRRAARIKILLYFLIETSFCR